MDPEGESMTNTGRILGMVATILWIVGIITFCGGYLFCFALFVGGGGREKAAGAANTEASPLGSLEHRRERPGGEGEGATRDRLFAPLTPGPSPPEYRGRGEEKPARNSRPTPRLFSNRSVSPRAFWRPGFYIAPSAHKKTLALGFAAISGTMISALRMDPSAGRMRNIGLLGKPCGA